METKETTATAVAQAPEAKPEVKVGPSKEQEAQAEKIMTARPDTDFALTYDTATGKLVMHGTGKGENALPWPQISIGKKAGIVIDDLRSYPEDGVRGAYDAAIEGDKRLEKQNARQQKKLDDAKAAAAKAAAGGTPATAVSGTGSVASDEQFETGEGEEAGEGDQTATAA